MTMGSSPTSGSERARRAYLGLHKSIGKSLQLAFAGFNAASSANVPTQVESGDLAGRLAISGTVDQGASADKTMRLRVGMSGYTDGAVAVSADDEALHITYDTNTVAAPAEAAASPADSALQPKLTLLLRNIPNGTFTGTLLGDFQMTGDLRGEVGLDLTISGEVEDDGTGSVRRRARTTTVTGTATCGDGEFRISASL
jgi:hypothetical protein